MTAKISKPERKLVLVRRILRKRNYGLVKSSNDYATLIYQYVFNRERIEKELDMLFRQLTMPRTESLADMFDVFNSAMPSIGNLVRKFATLFFTQGSKKVFDLRGNVLQFGIPEYTGEIDAFVEHNLKFIEDITLVQRKKMIDLLSQGIKKGKSYSQMASEIVAEVDHISQSRAKLIARNEAQRAYAISTEKTMREAGVEKYMWLSANDDRVSPICQSLHRNVFTFGLKGTMDWKDVTGKTYTIHKSPLPVRDSHVGCRCCIVADFSDK
jgi:SPP1 gp7 family putative phage head morphogenesis protein